MRRHCSTAATSTAATASGVPNAEEAIAASAKVRRRPRRAARTRRTGSGGTRRAVDGRIRLSRAAACAGTAPSSRARLASADGGVGPRSRGAEGSRDYRHEGRAPEDPPAGPRYAAPARVAGQDASRDRDREGVRVRGSEVRQPHGDREADHRHGVVRPALLRTPPMSDRTAPVNVRCAIYTRKSSEEGLDQRFTSLEAQREACEAYVKSQVEQGWTAVPTLYDLSL